MVKACQGSRYSILKFWDPQSRISHRFSGDFVGRVTPVPIPNTEVKPAGADGTARETAWESRKSPGLIQKARSIISSGPFAFTANLRFEPAGTFRKSKRCVCAPRRPPDAESSFVSIVESSRRNAGTADPCGETRDDVCRIRDLVDTPARHRRPFVFDLVQRPLPHVRTRLVSAAELFSLDNSRRAH